MERLSLELRTVHRRMARVKSSGQRQAASTLVSAMNMIPSAVSITADFDTASDVDELAAGIEQAVCKLAAAAAQSQSQGSST
ncbi:hypothetical protein [Mycolicibacterium lacusdiani]|uniref:hypothetical protein n=1 Tax=Mycolicibacterium lacusdiani TaxID=2895283 RepID=UPI001F1F801D|nr:hypothetical protein [Mycolicibacterium lacusdiani]